MKCLHYAINERRQGHSGNSKGCCVCVGEKKNHCKDVLFPRIAHNRSMHILNIGLAPNQT